MPMNSSGNAGRLAAVREIGRRTARRIEPLAKHGQGAKVSDLFGTNTFSRRVMKDKLPRGVYDKMQQTLSKGMKIDGSIANEVAHAVKEWALDKGATHFCHWFQPQTGLTAEKHDSFLSFDAEGQPIEHFSGSQLIQSEPDASSFPSGGMRSTFEARGYTAWDPTSPMFLMEGPNGRTLCVPSAFISYHGHALDKKTPLLRSMEAVSQRSIAILRLLGNTSAHRVVPTVGPEQEYFLIDNAFHMLRPDLLLSGRTLIGAPPPKGQELEDHYFGSIKPRVLAFMQEAELELYKLGVPVKTRHNEVAPSQFESAPIFEEANVAADHNQMVMEIFRQVARLHNFALLLHEKPFAGVNGSGKHNNWSLQDSDGNNLLEPGSTPDANVQFLVFLCATLEGVHRRSGLLRAAIASSGNDHRLGANEAPPAIISVFLGKYLSEILDNIESGAVQGETTEQKIINLGVAKLPEIAQDATDRNRTSPFAFTGNKFEFRAVGSSSSISLPMAVLNAAVAEALGEMAEAIDARVKLGSDRKKAALEIVRETVIATKAVRFEGNNYSDEWCQEAQRRGLPNLRKTPEALAELVRPEAREFFQRMAIFQEGETEALYHLSLERYLKDVEIEVQALEELARTAVLPAALKHQAQTAGALQNYFVATQMGGAPAPHAASQLAELDRVAALVAELHACLADLAAKSEQATAIEAIDKRARAHADVTTPACEALRSVCDRLEEVVDDQLWPLPKYREMLFLG